MRFLAYVHESFEDSFIRELLDLIRIKDAEIVNDGLVEFQIKKDIQKNMSKVILYSRCLRRLMLVFDSLDTNEFEDILRNLDAYYKRNKPSDLIAKYFKDLDVKFEPKTFCSRSLILSQSEFTSQDIDALIGEIVLKYASDYKVNLSDSDIILFNIISPGKTHFGIDLINKDLSKRDYKLFTLPNSLKSSLVFSVLYEFIDDDILKNIAKKNVVNYDVNDGSFLIEFAQYIRHISPLSHAYKDIIVNKYCDLGAHFDKPNDTDFVLTGADNNFNSINYVKKNLALSEVKDNVELSRKDLTWIDTKFGKKAVDLFFSYHLPRAIVNERELTKYVDELMYQLEFVLKYKAIILTTKPLLFNDVIGKKNYKLTITNRKDFLVGTTKYSILIIEAASDKVVKTKK